MGRHLTTAVVMAALAAAWPRAQQPAPQTFRGAVDLIAVHVQVVDRRGQPVAGLGPDTFEVTINGRRRRVVSADLIDSRAVSTALPNAPGVAPAASVPSAGSTPLALPGRVVILAVDCGSFDFASARGVLVAARTFIERLPPDDLVGLFAFPLGPKINPTTDRAAVVRALDSIVGQRDAGEGEFHLRPSELIDLSRWAETRSGSGSDLMLKICGENPTDQECVGRLLTAVKSATIAYEGEAYASLGMLGSLLRGLSGTSGRKTVVLASAGRIASDTPGARPDLDDLSLRLGKAAAEGNTALYTLFIDQSWIDQYKAETRRPNVTQTNLAGDSASLGRWLDLFSGSAGGSLVRVLVGSGEQAFERIVTEMSAYYLLGVEPAEADRDGRTHQIRVKVDQRDVTVRSRTWVVVPKRTTMPVTVPAAPTANPAASRLTSDIVLSPPPRPLSEAVASLAAAFERADYAAMQAGLARANALANVIRDFRAADNPWPNAPRRTAVFALELALAGLASGNGFASDEAIKLLAQYTATVRQAALADAFECAWYRTVIAGLEGLWLPETSLVFVTRGLQRCPAEPRLHLARGVIAEQQWRLDTRRTAPGHRSGVPGQRPEARDVLLLYDAAMRFPATDHEARVRAAWLCYRTGAVDRALELLDGVGTAPADPVVRYLHDLVRGQVLRARGRVDEAAVAFRGALATWPGAQSARVALMTLLLTRSVGPQSGVTAKSSAGLQSRDYEEAVRLADAVERAPDDHVDPWWTFEQGDYRMYRTVIAALREAGR